MASCNVAAPDFISQLETIEPSDTGPSEQHQEHRPCRLILRGGQIVPRAICVEDHRGFTTDSWIHPDAVERIEPSPERMPAPLASKLYAAGESGMGYQLFRMKMKDGTSHFFITSNVVDFPDLPEGYTTDDVEDVFPHEGREESHRRERTFRWCFYVRR
jgi:hypothetical protein